MKKLVLIVFMLVLILLPSGSLARDGYDPFEGDYVDVDKPNKLKVGRYVDYYDYNKGEYRSGTVDALKIEKNKIKMQVFDDEEGMDRSFELDKR